MSKPSNIVSNPGAEACRRRVWRCSTCGRRYFDADEMVARKVEWRTLGPKGRVVRTRTVAHDCVSCMATDPTFNLPPLAKFSNAADAAKERWVKANIDGAHTDDESRSAVATSMHASAATTAMLDEYRAFLAAGYDGDPEAGADAEAEAV